MPALNRGVDFDSASSDEQQDRVDGVRNVQPAVDGPDDDSGSRSGSPQSVASSDKMSSVGSDGSLPIWSKINEKQEVVISGISARLPESDTIDEFAAHLYNKEDMVTEDNRRWRPGMYDLPKRNGKLKDVSKFDAKYFGVIPKQADLMDPQMRILMEVVHEALVDAGINPQALRGSKTGVFVGASASETEAEALSNDPDRIHGYTLIGCQRAMFANRLSYAFDFRGPSLACDTACSSGLYAFNLALDSMRLGHCDQAVVAGAMLHLIPSGSLTFLRLNMMAKDGKSKSFDAKADGYVKAEGIVAIVLQKRPNAKRVYCTVVHAKSNTDGYKSSGITMPSGEVQAKLLQEVYEEAGVEPSEVKFFEAHGTGTMVGDPQECHAIETVMCENRDKALLIGSVKSNMGHCEPTSGLASIVKVVIGMERGLLPPNLHFDEPNPYIPGLLNGKMQVVTEPTPWKGGYAAVNSFGFGGANTHVLLKSNEADTKNTADQFPKLVCYSAPTAAAVQTVLETIEKHRTDNAFHALVSEQADAGGMNKNPYRGFIVLKDAESRDNIKQVEKLEDSADRPVWFIYPGMGSQWAGMAVDLLNTFSLFEKSVWKCSETLRPFGIDVYSMIMEGKEETFKNTMNCMVCNIAVQIALTDLFRAIGIEPIGIIGHSTGEIVCGYADGCFTLRQAMLCAYYRGKSVLDQNIGNGAMAAVGLTWEEAKNVCPEGVVPACHNAEDSVTISGDSEKVEKVVHELKAMGKFAKIVDTAGMAFHSPMMQKAKTKMSQNLKKVIPGLGKQRSKRWISTSVTDNNLESASFCSADYQVNNAMNPVLFHQAVQKIQQNAVCIEISPHALLQAVLRRSTPDTVFHVGLLKAKEEHESLFLLKSLGKLHLGGVSMKLHALSGDSSYPVPRGTPMLNSLLQWDHTESWNVVTVENGSILYTSCEFIIEPLDPQSPDHFLVGHVIDGRAIFPFTGHLVLAWRALCKLRHLDWTPENPPPITIENWEVLRPTILSKSMAFTVVTSPGTSYVQIYEGGEMASHGQMAFCEPRSKKPFYLEYLAGQTEEVFDKETRLYKHDIYKMMSLRGYDYREAFKCFAEVSLDSTSSILFWDGNWVAYLDGFLQYGVPSMYSQTDLVLPARIRYMRIDPESHFASIFDYDSGRRAIKSTSEKKTLSILCGGVEMIDAKAMSVQRRLAANGKLYIEQPIFVENYDKQALADEQFKSIAQEFCQYEADVVSLLVQLWNVWPEATKQKFSSLKPYFDTRLENCPDTSDDDCQDFLIECEGKTVLNLLIQLKKTNSVEEFKKIFSEYAPKLHNDVMYGACLQTRLLDILLFLVAQNIPGIKMKVCVIDPLNEQFGRTIATTLIRAPRYKVESTAVVKQELYDWQNESELEQLNTEILRSDGSLTDIPDARQNAFDLVVLDRILCHESDKQSLLKQVQTLIVEKGFLLITENTSKSPAAHVIQSLVGEARNAKDFHPLTHDQWIQLFHDAGLNVVAYQTDSSLWTTNYLLRRNYTTRPAKFLDCDDIKECSFVDEIKEHISGIYDDKKDFNLWLTSTKICDNGLYGLATCLRQELPNDEIRVRMIADVSVEKKNGNNLDLDTTNLETILNHDLLINLYRDGKWGFIQPIRVASDEVLAFKATDHAYLNTTARGDLSGLRWFDNTDNANTFLHSKISNNPDEPAPTFQMCHIHFAALNFRDVMLASGRLAPDAFKGLVDNYNALLGLEFSGVLDDGRRVMGIMPSQCFSTKMMVDTRYCFVIPDNMTLEEAATIPICYMTAYLALVLRGNIKLNQSILIHSGSGAVGQACISLARSFNARIFVTVGSDAKKTRLQKKFSFLTDDCFASSRTTDFEHMIKRATNGRGVDIIVNSLAEEKLHASVRCLAKHGNFLEIGKFDLMRNSLLGMECFMNNIAFHGILLDSLWGTPLMINVLRITNEAIADNVIDPLDRTVFPIDQAEEAFRFMTSGKHIGKVLLKIRDEPLVPSRKVLVPHENIQKVQVYAVSKPMPDQDHVYFITGGLGGFGFELLRWLVQRGSKKVVLSSRRGVRSGYQAYYLSQFRKAGVNVRLCHADITTYEGCETAIKFCLEDGPIGGIFHLAMVLMDTLVENQTPQNFKESAAAKYWATKFMDEVTRKHCGEELKWFVCFSSQTAARGNSGQMAYGWANSCMERFMEQRRHDGLAGQVIAWGAIGDVGVIIDNKGDNSTIVNGSVPQRLQSCLQCLDMIMVNNYTMSGVWVRHETENDAKLHKADVLQTIANIVGIKDVGLMNLNAKLSDLGIDSLMGMEIVQMLERNYEVVLSMKDVRNLTLLDIREMTTGKSKTVASTTSTNNSTTEQTVFNFNIRIDRSQVTGDVYKMLLPMNTKPETPANKAVYFVHPIEGVGVPLRPLVAQLDNAVFCLQCTPDTPQDRIETMASAYLEAIKVHRGGDKLVSEEFHLVGYSYGAVVLYEMACQLESLGVRPTSVTLIDSAPMYWDVMNKRYKQQGGLDENTTLDAQAQLWPLLQTELIVHLGSYYGVTDAAVRKELLACPTTQVISRVKLTESQARMDHMAKRMLAVPDPFFTDHSLASFVCLTLWNKHVMADRYVTTGKLYKGPMNLIKAESSLHLELPDDYGLSKIVDGEVNVMTVKGDHDALVLGESVTDVAAVLKTIFQQSEKRDIV